MRSKVVDRILDDFNKMPFYKRWRIQFKVWLYVLLIRIKKYF